MVEDLAYVAMAVLSVVIALAAVGLTDPERNAGPAGTLSRKSKGWIAIGMLLVALLLFLWAMFGLGPLASII